MRNIISRSAASLLALAALAGVSNAAETAAAHHGIERQPWSFAGFRGQFDQAQLQRGFQVYKEVCAACHGLKRVYFRNLSEPGGPGFSEEGVKALAAEWPNQIPEPNDQGEVAKDGELIKRPAKPFDPILGPYLNDKQARAAQNGALPPDLSVIAKARGVHREVSWMIHPFLMLGDIIQGYQEGGPDYLYALLTGYTDPPADVTVGEGMSFNTAFPGNQLAMPPPLSEGVVTYEDGTKGTVENYARDVSAFLAWAADPSLDQRKRIGWQVMLYLLVTTVLLYFGKRRIWSKLH
ncbi:MAG TPA: cytochrome c1 [Hyphomicrobium sp.]|nr:cytochrome c1 [Hyphomicrobium sp.]